LFPLNTLLLHPWQTPEGLRVTVTLFARLNVFIDKFWFYSIRHFSLKRLSAGCGHVLPSHSFKISCFPKTRTAFHVKTGDLWCCCWATFPTCISCLYLEAQFYRSACDSSDKQSPTRTVKSGMVIYLLRDYYDV